MCVYFENFEATVEIFVGYWVPVTNMSDFLQLELFLGSKNGLPDQAGHISYLRASAFRWEMPLIRLAALDPAFWPSFVLRNFKEQ